MQWTEVRCYKIGRSYGTGFLYSHRPGSFVRMDFTIPNLCSEKLSFHNNQLWLSVKRVLRLI